MPPISVNNAASAFGKSHTLNFFCVFTNPKQVSLVQFTLHHFHQGLENPINQHLLLDSCQFHQNLTSQICVRPHGLFYVVSRPAQGKVCLVKIKMWGWHSSPVIRNWDFCLGIRRSFVMKEQKLRLLSTVDVNRCEAIRLKGAELTTKISEYQRLLFINFYYSKIVVRRAEV